MLPKPASCTGCALESRGTGWVPPYRPPNTRVLLLGESAGAVEASRGEPFIGPAGGKLNHLLYMLGVNRSHFSIHNVISCRPPNDWLEGAPWEIDAVQHCRPNLDVVLDQLQPGSVIVPLGGAATRRILEQERGKFELKNFHGTVTPWGNGCWVVPSFHPSHILRGAHNLTGVVTWDLKRALTVAENGWQQEQASLFMDPDVAWFEAWVNTYLEAVTADPVGVWLAVDIETPDKERKGDEGELKPTDRSYTITRVNFSYHPDEGVTVPFEGPYIALIGRLLASLGPKILWNKSYDLKRLWRIYGVEKIRGALLDFMDAWHALHSDLPKGLGFVAPWYSGWGAWKHLSGSEPAKYGALDGVQTLRCAFGIAKGLQDQGMWNVFWRHMHEVDQYATGPSCQVGLLVDRKALEGHTDDQGVYHPGMRDELRDHARRFFEQAQEIVPEDLRPLHPKGGWVHKPETDTVILPAKEDPLQLPRAVVNIPKLTATRKCLTCGAVQVPVKHRCKTADGKPDKAATPQVVNVQLELPRYHVRKPFNPGSAQQVLKFILHAGHKPGKNKSGKPSADRETIERLMEGKPKSKIDGRRRELYPILLDFRDVKKVLGNYVEGTIRRLEMQRADGIDDDRLRPDVTNNPSTIRTSYVNPNLQNVVADRRGEKSLSAGFRKAIKAQPGCKLIEADYSAIEAVITGWKMGDPQYIKLAWLGVHDHLTSIAVGEPADLSWPLEQLLQHYSRMKEAYPIERDQNKRVVHGTNYLLTAPGMAKRFRKLFPNQAAAERLQNLYYDMAPKLKPWQHHTQEIAHKEHELGGPGKHPFGYRHEFWNVIDFKPLDAPTLRSAKAEGKPVVSMNGRDYLVTLGQDAKRAVAFYPQSIAAGIIREASLLLFKPGEAPNPDWYIGQAFYGRTPLRAIIHDSFLLEVPEELVDWVIERLLRVMTRPMVELPCPEEWGVGPYLRIGVGVKVGDNWAEMKKVKVPDWAKVLGVAESPDVAPEVEEDLDSDLEDDPTMESGEGYLGDYSLSWVAGQETGAGAEDVPF